MLVSRKVSELLNVSLNDAAALLIQLEPDDVEEMAHLKKILSAIAENTLQPQSFRMKILRAIQIIEEISAGSSADPYAALSEIGSLIEAAMNVIEENQKESLPEDAVPEEFDEISVSARADENEIAAEGKTCGVLNTPQVLYVKIKLTG